jgi:DNA repair protein RecN (Recombination protein N)
MLKSLKISNLILIEKAEIILGPGLNILTGETGAGKSAVLTAIKLISGERADTGLIRDGAHQFNFHPPRAAPLRKESLLHR